MTTVLWLVATLGLVTVAGMGLWAWVYHDPPPPIPDDLAGIGLDYGCRYGGCVDREVCLKGGTCEQAATHPPPPPRRPAPPPHRSHTLRRYHRTED